MEIAPLYKRRTIQRTCDSLTRIDCTNFAFFAATYTHIQQGTVVFSLCDHVGSADTFLAIFCNHLFFRRIFQDIINSSLRDVILVREELLYQVFAGKHTFPWVTCACIRHTADSGCRYEVSGTCIRTGFQTILTDREDDFLHGLWVAVIVAHEQLLVTAVTVLFCTAKIVFTFAFTYVVENLVAIIDSLLVILHLTIGINFRVKSQAGMKCVCCTTVGTSEILTVIISAHLSHQRLDGGQFIIQPVVEILSLYLGRETIVESELEWSLAIQVKEIIVVQCTEEANFCDFVFAQAA